MDEAVQAGERAVNIGSSQCGAWCFILGAAVGAFCSETKGHDDDHRTEIKVFVEPKSSFTILWRLDRSLSSAEPQ